MAEVRETIDPQGRRILDVSALPNDSIDSCEPVWWGNALLMCIETTTIILLLVTYFYLRKNFTIWPPPNPNTVPPLYRPVPDLLIPSIEAAIAVLSCLPMYWTDMAARRDDAPAVKRGLWLMIAVCVVMIVLRFMEMRSSHLKFKWDDNAYASTIWTILGLHLTYLLGAVAEFFIMVLWIHKHSLDPKHGLDVTLAGGYWYWTAITWVACFATVYIGARVL